MNEEDLLMAQQVARETKRLAHVARGHYWAKMNPQDVPWAQAADLVDMAMGAAWCIGWLVAEVRRLGGELRAERSLREGPYVRILGQVRSLARGGPARPGTPGTPPA